MASAVAEPPFWPSRRFLRAMGAAASKAAAGAPLGRVALGAGSGSGCGCSFAARWKDALAEAGSRAAVHAWALRLGEGVGTADALGAAYGRPSVASRASSSSCKLAAAAWRNSRAEAWPRAGDDEGDATRRFGDGLRLTLRE